VRLHSVAALVFAGAIIILAGCGGPAGAVTAPPYPFTVQRASVSGNTSFTGVCPTTVNFTGTILAWGSGMATYVWERSDGQQSEPQALTCVDSGTPPGTVVTTCQAAYYTVRVTSSGSAWVRFHVTAPIDLRSVEMNYTTICTPR